MTHSVHWVPTEQELVSIGFYKKYDYMQITFERGVEEVHIAFSTDKQFVIEIVPHWIDDIEEHADAYVYPKSLEELKTLISMMTP